METTLGSDIELKRLQPENALSSTATTVEGNITVFRYFKPLQPVIDVISVCDKSRTTIFVKRDKYAKSAVFRLPLNVKLSTSVHCSISFNNR